MKRIENEQEQNGEDKLQTRELINQLKGNIENLFCDRCGKCLEIQVENYGHRSEKVKNFGI